MQKRGIFKSKKADSTHELYQVIIELVLLSIIAISIFSYISSIKNQTITEKIFLSRDIALTANTIQSLPGNIHYSYTDDKAILENFIIETSKHISVEEKENGRKVQFPYIKNYFLNINTKILKGNQTINLDKAGDDFIISQKETLNLLKLSCPTINTKLPDNILLIYTNQETKIIAEMISNHINVKLSEKIEPDQDLIIKLSSKKQYLKSFIANNNLIQKERKLSCLMINELLNSQSAEATSIITSNKYQEEIIYINLEFDTTDQQKTAEKITQAIQKYNE